MRADARRGTGLFGRRAPRARTARSGRPSAAAPMPGGGLRAGGGPRAAPLRPAALV
jgi:hypothetical protein